MLTLSAAPFRHGSEFNGSAEDLLAIFRRAPAYASQISAILTKGAAYLPTIVKVVEDPALPQVVRRIETLRTIAAKKAPSAPSAPSVPSVPGVGLHRVVPLLDAAIWYSKYPWAPWAIGAAAVLALGGIGFGLGRWTRRRR